MRRKIKSAIFFVSIFVSFSCSDNINVKERNPYKIVQPLKIKDIKFSDTVEVDTFYDKNGEIDQILRRKDHKLNGFSFSFYPSGILKTQKYFLNDTARGIFLQFYESGRIMKFSYLVDDDHNIWYRQYDEKGNFIKEEGSPLIRGDVHRSDNHDTAFLKVFICSYGAKDLKFELSSNDKDYKVFDLKHTDEPYVVEANSWKLVKQLKRFGYFFRISFVDSSNNLKIYKDSVAFKQ
jgi:hypothetical protein